MNTDIRVAVSFRGHRKRKRLRLLLGPGSTDYLIDLWLSTAMNHPGGVLQGMDTTDIALEAGWEGDPQAFVDALLQCVFLEHTPNGDYALHDWEFHQGYVVHAEERRERAKKAAAKRWNPDNVSSMPDALPKEAGSNAPAPLPSPDPVPIPVPLPEPVPAPQGIKKKTPSQVFAEDSEPYRLAVLMRDTLKANLPTLREPNMQAWAKDFDVALRNDSRMHEPHFVAQVITWACAHSFWRGNIQSPGKLREKFDQLTAKMEADSARATPPWQSPAERRVSQNQAAAAEAKALLFGGKGEEYHARQ